MAVSWRVASFLLAVVALLNAQPTRAQDLDAGKSGERLFATNCTMCHRTPRGLAKNTNRLSLFYFLRQHYTSSQASAGEVAAYLLASEGNSTRARDKPKVAGQQPATSWWSATFTSTPQPAPQQRKKTVRRGKSAAPQPPSMDVPSYPPDVPEF